MRELRVSGRGAGIIASVFCPSVDTTWGVG